MSKQSFECQILEVQKMISEQVEILDQEETLTPLENGLLTFLLQLHDRINVAFLGIM